VNARSSRLRESSSSKVTATTAFAESRTCFLSTMATNVLATPPTMINEEYRSAHPPQVFKGERE
jgi:hypothetical protein